MLMIYVFLVVMSAIIAAVGGLGLTTTMSLNVLERRRELGVLRAIGASPGMIVLMIVGEGLVVGVLGFMLAALAAWPVSKILGDSIALLMAKSSLDFSFAWRGLWIWLAVSLGLGALASIVPAWHASRGPVRDAIA
jgi:putative ABC transport system permease protein